MEMEGTRALIPHTSTFSPLNLLLARMVSFQQKIWSTLQMLSPRSGYETRASRDVSTLPTSCVSFIVLLELHGLLLVILIL